MSQVRKYQEGGITPIKKDDETKVVEQITPVVPGLEEIILKQKTVPTTKQSIQKPTSYIILDGEKFENNEENRQKIAQYFAKVADPNGGSKALNQIKDLIFEASQNGYSINYDTPGNELSYIDPTGQSHFIDWGHLNDRKDKRIQKERSWLGRFFDSAFNTDVQQTAEDIYKMKGLGNYLRGNATTETAVDPNLININWGDDKFFEYLKDDKGQIIKDENGNLKYNTNSIQNQNLMQILNKINKYLGLQTDDERNQFKLANVWTTDDKLDAIKSIYDSNIEGWKQQYQNIIGKVTSGQQLTPEELSWLELFGISTKKTSKTPEELAADAAEVTKQKWINAGYESLYDKGKDWFDLGEDNLLTLNDIGKTSLGDYLFDSSGNEFNDDWIKYLKSKNADIANYDWLNGYTLYNGKLYKTSSGTDPNSALAKIYSTSGFIDKNKANQYGEAQKIINTFWGNPYEWNTADDSMYSGFTWNPSANNGTGGYRMDRHFRNETGRYSGISSNQQLVSYYDPDAERDYRGMWTDVGQRFAITDEYGDVIADGLTAADLEQRGIKKIIDSAGNEVPYDSNNKFHQRALYKSNDARINNHTGIFFGENNEYALYYNPMRSPNPQDPYSHVLYTDPELEAAYVVPATLAKFLYQPNANGIPGIQALIADVNLQKRFRNILKRIADGRLLGGRDSAIKDVCKELGMTPEQADQVCQEADRMSEARKENGSLNYKVAKEAIDQAAPKDETQNSQVASQKQGGIIRKFAPGGGFAKASGSTASTKSTNVKIRDSRQAAKIGVNVKDGEGKFTDADWADLGGLIADMVSVGLGSMPIAGGISGLLGTSAGLYADISRDGFQWSDLGTAGLNAGMDIVSMLPGLGSGVQAAKVASKIAKKYKWVIQGLSLLGATTAIPLVDKLVKEGNLSVQEWKALASGLVGATNIAKLGGLGKSTKKGAFKNIDINSKTAVESLTIKPKTGEDLPDITLTKEQLRELDSITDPVKKQDKFRGFVRTALSADPRTKGKNVNSLIEKYDLSESTKPVSTGSSGEITLNTRNPGEGPEITLSKAEIDEINVQPTAAAKMAKARETVAHKLWEKRGKPIGTPEIDEKNALKYNYRDLWNPRVKEELAGRSDITLDKTDIENISKKKSPEEQQKAFVEIIKNKSGDSSLDSVDKIKDAFKVDDFFENRFGEWKLLKPKTWFKKGDQFVLKAERVEEAKPPRGNKGVINPIRDWWNNVGTYRGINRSSLFDTKPATTPTPTPATPTSGTSGETRTGINWKETFEDVFYRPPRSNKGITVMQLGNNPWLKIHNYSADEAPGVIEDGDLDNIGATTGRFTYKVGGKIRKAQSGWKFLPQDWKTKLAQSAVNKLPTIGEFRSMVGAIKANNKLRDTLNKGLENPPMVIAPQYNVPRFNDNGVLNEGRQLIKNIYNRQPANYTSDAMLNNFVKKASQEKATEYQNKINNLFSQQLAQHNAKMDEIFYKNRENQIAAQNQNQQTIYANQNAKAKNNAATQISNWQSVDNFVKSRLTNLNKQRLAAIAMKENLASAKMTAQLLNDTGYTDAKQKYREYITKNPTGVDFDTWLLTAGAGYKSAYDDAIAIARKSNISDQIDAANLGLYGNNVQSYADKIFGNNPLFKSGGKVSKSNYRGYRDYKEQIAIDSHKEIRKAIAQLNKDCQQLLLKMLK